MTEPAERMKAMRTRRRSGDLREVRLVLPDPRRRAVRERVADAVAALDSDDEADALTWIESVGLFDDCESTTPR